MHKALFAFVVLAPLSLAPMAARADTPLPCPAAGSVVERTAGPPLVYLGADPKNPEACLLLGPDGKAAAFWFATWKLDWPGADAARDAIRRAYVGGPGTVIRFDTVAAPGYSWHETIRNGGYEQLSVLGAVHRTLRMVHEREGFDGNTYHSIITQWKDVATGMTIYQNYIHISGQPEPYTSWNPLVIHSAR